MWIGIWHRHRAADFVLRLQFLGPGWLLALPGMPDFSMAFLPSLYPLLCLSGVGHSFCAFLFPSLSPWGHQQVCFLIPVQGVCFEDNFSPSGY